MGKAFAQKSWSYWNFVNYVLSQFLGLVSTTLGVTGTVKPSAGVAPDDEVNPRTAID